MHIQKCHNARITNIDVAAGSCNQSGRKATTRGGFNVQVNRRQFFKICSAGLGGSSIAMLGYSPTAALAEVRDFKLARATETRNMCPYCSVS